jgi:2-polyprenyl-6-methoxyphenol hydroxylase-like FAD-dependent oxidoreductase
MAGLLAARALADHYAHVTLLERATLPGTDTGESRKGVPQGRQVHGLLSGGLDVFEVFLPSLIKDLTDRGTFLAAITRDVRFFLDGGYLCEPESSLPFLLVSRPLLENRVRARVLALPKVSIVDECDIVGLEADAAGARITGVRARRRSVTANGALLPANLVVDATGRGSRLPTWLTALGSEPPTQERVEVHVGYATRLYRRPTNQAIDTLALIGASSPEMPRSGVMAAIEGDRWIVGLTGYFRDYPPTDDQGFRSFAANLPTHEIAAIVEHAEPLGPAIPYRFPASQRWHYERLSRFPKGLLVVGDAICSFNPVYGQGMSVAALEAQALDACLDDVCLDDAVDRLAWRFFARTARILNTPRCIAVGGDRRFPALKASQSLMDRVLNWYLTHLRRAARHDPEVALAFQRVANLVAEPSSLLHPHIAWRVVVENLHHTPGDAPRHPKAKSERKTARRKRSETWLAM